MKRTLILALLALPLLGLIGGCVIVPGDGDGYRHHHEWRDHDRW
jgi:hypothetical protein